MYARWAALVFCLPCTGCLLTNSVHIGPPQAPRGEGCAVTFEQLRYQDAISNYDQVGAVCANVTEGAADRYEFVRRGVAEEACGLGGDMVTVVGTCAVGKVPGVEYGVFRRRGT